MTATVPLRALPAIAGEQRGLFDSGADDHDRAAAEHRTASGKGGTGATGVDLRAAEDAPPDDEVDQLIEALTRAVSAQTLDGLDGAGLKRRFAQLRRIEGLTSTGMARAVSRLTRCGQVRGDGASSTSSWVRTNTGRTTREATRLSRLADALDRLPATAAAVAEGAITEDSAEVIVRALDEGRLGEPGRVEQSLLDVARNRPHQLRAEVRRRTQSADAHAMLTDENRQHAARRLSLIDRPDGMTAVHGQLPAESGDRLRTMLRPWTTRTRPARRPSWPAATANGWPTHWTPPRSSCWPAVGSPVAVAGSPRCLSPSTWRPCRPT